MHGLHLAHTVTQHTITWLDEFTDGLQWASQQKSFLPERMHTVGAESEKSHQKPSVGPMACSSQALVWEREAKLMRKILQGLGPWLGPEHGSCTTARQMALVSLLLMGLHKTERISPLHSLIGQLL